ncbi:hypothetical protein M413DRAFT_6626 [Hebeloma cylindrosporum]|uniref:Uncharacterized protein n=1 Tax=Hebeloma cylindrosporum TaxID=76867 RepID=A0A0C2Z980_HEBCY|nr:hypothetical protein M413DRAFT_6626 [Hebeloma cylindrosporum h7]
MKIPSLTTGIVTLRPADAKKYSQISPLNYTPESPETQPRFVPFPPPESTAICSMPPVESDSSPFLAASPLTVTAVNLSHPKVESLRQPLSISQTNAKEIFPVLNMSHSGSPRTRIHEVPTNLWDVGIPTAVDHGNTLAFDDQTYQARVCTLISTLRTSREPHHFCDYVTPRHLFTRTRHSMPHEILNPVFEVPKPLYQGILSLCGPQDSYRYLRNNSNQKWSRSDIGVEIGGRDNSGRCRKVGKSGLGFGSTIGDGISHNSYGVDISSI